MAIACMARTAAGIIDASRGPCEVSNGGEQPFSLEPVAGGRRREGEHRQAGEAWHRHLQHSASFEQVLGQGDGGRGTVVHQHRVGVEQVDRDDLADQSSLLGEPARGVEAGCVLGLQHLQGRPSEQRLDPGVDEPVLRGHLGGPVEQVTGRSRVGKALHLGEDHQGVAQLFGVTVAFRACHGPERVCQRLVEQAGAVCRVGEEGRGARVVGASRALDEVTHRVPPACQDGGSGESEGQLDVLGTGRLVEHRRGDIQGFARTALEAQQPGPLGGRGGAVRRDACEPRRAAARRCGTLRRPGRAVPG